jgi:hypothetical protein
MNTIKPARHTWEIYKNTTRNWCDTDSYEQYQNNLQKPKNKELLQKYGYTETSISYKFNSHGFRCAEFSSTPGFISLGCSHTGGVGLSEQQIWPSLVAQTTGLTNWNLGVAGTSMDTCLRLLNHYVDLLKPKFVMLLCPDPARLEFFVNNDIVNILPAKSKLDFEKIWYSNDTNIEMNFLKNNLAMQQICNSRNIKLIVKDCVADLLGPPPIDTSARDLLHVGSQRHRLCAELFLKELN